MNFVWNTLPWWGWLTLLAVPPLIFLLYFLKLRRSPVEVPSTWLWAKAIEDMHVNSLWQRLRKNLLMLLQILFALLLLATCLRPGCDGTELVGQRYIFLVDNSASMSATDTPSGVSRLKFAKQEIRKTISQMPTDTSVMLISFSDQASVVQSYTRNKSEALIRLEGIRQTERLSDLNEALVAAAGLANPGRTSDKESSLDVQVADALDAVLMIYSDGGVRKVPRFAQGKLSPEYHSVGNVDDPPANVGIVAFSVSEPAEDGSAQVFARLQNSDDEAQSVSVSLFVGEQLQDAEADIEIDAGQMKSVSFDLPSVLVNVDEPVAVQLKIDQDDIYLQDNQAFSVINPPGKSNVLVVARDNQYFQFACSTELIKKQAKVEFQDWDYLEEAEYFEKSVLREYDLALFEGIVPEVMPRCNTLVMGVLPKTGWTSIGKNSPTPIFDFDSAHPLLSSVQMGSVTIINSDNLEGPKGSLSLIESSDGPIGVLAPREGFLDFVLGFSIVEFDDQGNSVINSDWPKKLSFPIFIQNVIANLGGASRFTSDRNVKPGDLLKLKRNDGVTRLEIETPDGRMELVEGQKENSFQFSGTNRSGIYRIRDAETKELQRLVPVNLLDATESNLTVRESLDLGYSEYKQISTQVPSRKEWWPWVLAVGLVLLMVEWLIYNRRVLI